MPSEEQLKFNKSVNDILDSLSYGIPPAQVTAILTGCLVKVCLQCVDAKRFDEFVDDVYEQLQENINLNYNKGKANNEQ